MLYALTLPILFPKSNNLHFYQLIDIDIHSKIVNGFKTFNGLSKHHS